jgi:hypothetical protein
MLGALIIAFREVIEAGPIVGVVLAPGGAKQFQLSVNALAVRRYPCIAVNLGPILRRISATRTPFYIKAILAGAYNYVADDELSLSTVQHGSLKAP